MTESHHFEKYPCFLRKLSYTPMNRNYHNMKNDSICHHILLEGEDMEIAEGSERTTNRSSLRSLT